MSNAITSKSKATPVDHSYLSPMPETERMIANKLLLLNIAGIFVQMMFNYQKNNLKKKF